MKIQLSPLQDLLSESGLVPEEVKALRNVGPDVEFLTYEKAMEALELLIPPYEIRYPSKSDITADSMHVVDILQKIYKVENFTFDYTRFLFHLNSLYQKSSQWADEALSIANKLSKNGFQETSDRAIISVEDMQSRLLKTLDFIENSSSAFNRLCEQLENHCPIPYQEAVDASQNKSAARVKNRLNSLNAIDILNILKIHQNIFQDNSSDENRVIELISMLHDMKGHSDSGTLQVTIQDDGRVKLLRRTWDGYDKPDYVVVLTTSSTAIIDHINLLAGSNNTPILK